MEGLPRVTARRRAGATAMVLRSAVALTAVLGTAAERRPDHRLVSVRTARTARSLVPPLVAGIVLTQLADLATFMAAVPRTGIGEEQNAIARQLFVQAGGFGPLLLKIASILILLLIVRRISIRFPERAPLAAAIAIGFGALGVLSNVAFGLLG